jgi:hypothetical protein
MMELLREFWGIVAAALAGLVWLIRLEARSLANEREIRRMAEQRREDLQSAKEARETTNEMLREIRSDIKNLAMDVRRQA